MFKVLKNFKNIDLPIKGFRGRDLMFLRKRSKTFNMENEEEQAEYNLWLDRYTPFIGDISIKFYPDDYQNKLN